MHEMKLHFKQPLQIKMQDMGLLLTGPQNNMSRAPSIKTSHT